jgi:ABC-type methionine transport system ATPase subunit
LAKSSFFYPGNVALTYELDIVPVIANRVIVLGENCRILADGSVERILSDCGLLLEADLIREQLHESGLRSEVSNTLFQKNTNIST